MAWWMKKYESLLRVVNSVTMDEVYNINWMLETDNERHTIIPMGYCWLKFGKFSKKADGVEDLNKGKGIQIIG